MTSFLLFSLFQLIAQNAIWTFPHQQVKMMQGQFPAVSPIGAGTPVTTVHSYNAIQDDNGNLLFYIVNEELFDNNGVYVSDLLNGNPNSGSFLCLGYPEMCIVPVNDLPTCNKYFIIGGSPNGPNNQSPPYNGITPQWFVYNADTKVLTGNTNNGGGNLIDINGAPNDWFQLNYHFLDMHFAVSKRNCNTGNRLLFMYNGLKLYYSTVSNTSISNATEIPTLVTPQISSNNACEMEVLEKADGTYLLAFFSESVWPNYRINIIHLAANGFTVLNESFVNISEWAYGLEFSPSGKYLYTTIDAPFTTLHFIDLSAVNPTLQALPASNMVQSQFGKSQIELGVDGKLYFFRNASGNLQIPAFLTPENPLSNSWQLSAIPGLNFPFPNGYRGSGILPDQIDGENYYTKGIINSPVTITQTPDIPLCADQYNTATLTATTECPPLSYSWSNGTSIVGITPAIEVNNPGVYTVTLTYQCGYTSTASIQVYNCCEGTYRVDGIKTLSSLTNCPFLTISGNSAVMQNIFNCNSPNDPHPTIAVNGRLIVDMNFDVDGMEFIMGPNSEIVVQYGKIIRNTIPSSSPFCDYFHGCGEYMWRGIYLEGSVGNDNALFFSNTAVYIEDAKHGIWSKDNAKLTVSNVTFNKNNMGILFTPPLFGSSTNTSSITNCKFMCNDKNTLALQTCIRPYLGLRSNTGVKSNDIDFLQIGNDGNSNNRNYFRNLDTGIAVIYGEANIVNNQFSDMPLIDPNDDGLENGIGIAAYGFKQNPAKVTIGNIGLGENIFERLEYGIHTRNMVENETRYNKFYDTRFGMYLASHTKSAINIYENEFTNFSMGIFGLNMTNPINNCTVFNNRINPNGGIGATGIRLGANNGLSFYANVYGNGINGCRTGISILNATEVNTDFNTICFFSNPAPNMLEHVGIRALNCNKIDARENAVKWITHPPQTNMSLYANKVKGYLFNTSSNGTIHNNQAHWCGHGFETIFNCPNLKFTCNLNQDTYNGFYLIGATLPNQVQNLGNDEANVNTWINNFGQFNIDGSCSPFEWYYDPNITYSFPVPFDPNYVQPKIETTAVDCSLLQDDELGSTLEGIIQDSTNYNNFIEENRYAEDEFAYHTLRADTIHELNIDSLLRLQFEQTMNQDVIGQFYQVAELINNGEIDAAYNLNQAITDTRMVAENIKTVNDIFLRTVAIGNSIGANDKETLMSIATTLSLVGGEATFWARSLLGVDFEDLLSNYLRESKTETTKDKLNVVVKLMPNPTNGKVILNSSHPINFIEVYNSLQQQVGVAQTNMDAQTIEFDFEKIEGNVFFIKAVFEQDVRFYTVIVNH